MSSSHPYKAAILQITAAFFYALMAIFTKFVDGHMGVFQLVFYRFLIGFILLCPFVIHKYKSTVLRPVHLKLQLLHAFLGIFMIGTFYYSVWHAPLANVLAAVFSSPIFLVILAALFLNEKIRRLKSFIIVLGFMGVLMVVAPHQGMGLTSLTLLANPLIVALVVMVAKKLTPDISNWLFLFYFGAFASLFSAPLAAMNWQALSMDIIPFVLAIGVLSMAAKYFSYESLKFGDSSTVITFGYSQIILGGVVDYIVFGVMPTQMAMVGAVIIMGSAWWLAQHEKNYAHFAK